MTAPTQITRSTVKALSTTRMVQFTKVNKSGVPDQITVDVASVDLGAVFVVSDACAFARSGPRRSVGLTFSRAAVPHRIVPSLAGSWAEDKRTGTGTYTYPNGDTYEGGWAMDARDGFGVYTYAETGSKYEGSWSNGKRHGDGKFVHKTHQYEGNFTDDQALGVGKFYFDSGAIQKGSFVVDGADDAGENEDEAVKPTMKWVGSEISMKTA